MECNLGRSPDRRPSFYKITWLDNLDFVQIPPGFKQHLMNAQTNRVTLRTGAGQWDVNLLQDEEGGNMYLFRGWKEFVAHHSLGNAEVLVFKYNGDMSFNVVIYNKNGTERNYQSG